MAEGGDDGTAEADGDGAIDGGGDGEGEAATDGDAAGAGVGVADGSTPGASSTIPPSTPAPTATPMTRPAAIANLPPIGGERTSTTRSEARAATVDYHSAAMSGLPSSALSAIRTRLLPALLTALGVLLITAGLLSYADPTTAGTVPDQSPIAIELSPDPSASLDAPSPSASDAPSGSPGASAGPTQAAGPAHATRVVIPALDIDLPVVPGPNGYPYCNVAMYIDGLGKPLQDLGQPGRGIATYLFAHARDGMFGPIYEYAIQKHKPDKLLGHDRPGLHERQQAVPVRGEEGAAPPAQPRRGVRRQQRAALAPDLGRARRGRRARRSSRRRCCRSATRIRPTPTPSRSR